MKILHITASYKPAFVYGGPIYSVAALSEALVKTEVRSLKSVSSHSLLYNVEVITTLANGKEELPYPSGEIKIVEGVPVRYFKRWTKDHSHFSPALLWHLWKTAKTFDVIHIHSWWNLVSMGSVLICIIKGINPIISPRGMLGDYTFTPSKKFFHQWVGKYLLRKCTIHATTMMEAKEISATLKIDDTQLKIVDLMSEEDVSRKWKVESRKSAANNFIQIFVVHNLVQLPTLIHPRKQISDGVLKLIFLSRIHPKKGIELLLEALFEVDFPFSLTIVGEGATDYLESLKFKVESLKLSHAVKWIGAVYGDEKFKLLSENDLFVLPSFNENFANTVIESLAVGTPVLISENVGLEDYIEKNNYGLIHEQNASDLKEKLNYFYHHPIKEVTLKDDYNLIAKYDLMYHA